MNEWIRRSIAAGTGLALTTLLGAVAWSQSEPAPQPNSPATPQSQTASPSPQSQPAASDAQPAQQPPQARTIQMVPAIAQLDKTLDAKKAKQGDPVTAKLQMNVTIPDSDPLPKNTVLEGHVDQVQASDHKSDSMMTVTFDKAKLKDGKEVPIKATVIKVSEPVYAQQQGAGGTPGQPMPSSAPSGPGGGSSAPSGGGSMGGGSSAPAPAPQPMSTPDPSASSGQQAQGSGGVPDVTLKSSIHESSSATFMSKGKNVHVPDGTQMEVALAVIPAGVTLK